jgi:hypothetical protein
MKTIIENETNVSKYLFEDAAEITLESNRIVIGNTNNPELYINDLNSSTATVHTNVTAPLDNEGNLAWKGCKYTFDGATWAQNLNWVDPDAE